MNINEKQFDVFIAKMEEIRIEIKKVFSGATMSAKELKPCPFCGAIIVNGLLCHSNECFVHKLIHHHPASELEKAWQIRTLDPMLEELARALEKLSVLGNEPFSGNSIGNVIAQQALEKYRALKMKP